MNFMSRFFILSILNVGMCWGSNSVGICWGNNKDVVMTERAVFAAGCFWGIEAAFQSLDGVIDTTVGYVGGTTKNPSYKSVCSGKTGHAEGVEVVYDPTRISYEQLLNVFWALHDPTTLNAQGPNVGTQYRSALFYTSLHQKLAAEKGLVEVQKQWKKPVVTQLIDGGVFYPAEEYHQDYFLKKGIYKKVMASQS